MGRVHFPSHLASFAFQVDFELNDSKLKSLLKNYEKSFYWEKQSEDIAIYGFGELITISESGKGRFAATEKRVKQFAADFSNNWEAENLSSIPLFVGGMKFYPDNDEMWENYADSGWFVPHILVRKKDGLFTIFYNFFISGESSSEKLIKEFYAKLQLLKNESDVYSSKPVKKVAMQTITGNSPKDKKKWTESVKKAVRIIEVADLQKIVLSRKVELGFNDEPDIRRALDMLLDKYPECCIFAFHSARSTFFGASPEKLFRMEPGRIETDALAGSAPRGLTESEDKTIEEQILRSEKNLWEHKTVINYLTELLHPVSDEIIYEDSPAVKKLLNIQHLWTPVKAKLKIEQKIFHLLELIHPTPSVCGVPQAGSMINIRKMEDYSRGMYAGAVGWFNFEGHGEFTVALRSALAKGKKVYAFAGCGIVEGSDPVTEFRETELKLKPILALFENEN